MQARWLNVCAGCALIVMGTGCATMRPGSGEAEAPPGEVMVTSYYGRRWQGVRTASGERFDANSLTAAHKKLPFGTVLRLKNPENGRTVVVTVNNRGPFVKGRHLDVAERVARDLGFHKKGVTRLEVTILGRDERYAKYLRKGRPVGPAPNFETEADGSVKEEAPKLITRVPQESRNSG